MMDAERNFELAVKYVKGDGVEKDIPKAVALFTQAAEAGHSKAQYNLGVIYLNGIGIQMEPNKAVEWFKRAANQNHDQARRALEKINAEIEKSSNVGVVSPVNSNSTSNEISKGNVVCPSCKTPNSNGKNFCCQCGGRLNIRAPAERGFVDVTPNVPSQLAKTTGPNTRPAGRISAIFVVMLVALGIASNWYFNYGTLWKLSGVWECRQNNGSRTTEKYGFFGSYLQTIVGGRDVGLQFAGKYSLSNNSFNIVLNRAMRGDRTVDLDETQQVKFMVDIKELSSTTLSYSMETATLDKTGFFDCTRF